MSEQHWTIVDTTSGEVLAQVITSGTHPRFHGFPWDGETMTAHMVDRQGDPAIESFTDGEWAFDAAKFDPRMYADIDAQAGAVRLRFITEVPGQQLIYMHKEMEARAFLTAEAPDVADYPLIGADVEALGITAEEAAQQVVAKADLWTHLAAAIEAARLGAKRAVSEAQTMEDKEAASVVDWEAVLAGAGQ